MSPKEARCNKAIVSHHHRLNEPPQCGNGQQSANALRGTPHRPQKLSGSFPVIEARPRSCSRKIKEQRQGSVVARQAGVRFAAPAI